MPRPEEKPPTEGGQKAAIDYIIAVNEQKISDYKKEIEKYEKINELLKT